MLRMIAEARRDRTLAGAGIVFNLLRGAPLEVCIAAASLEFVPLHH